LDRPPDVALERLLPDVGGVFGNRRRSIKRSRRDHGTVQRHLAAVVSTSCSLGPLWQTVGLLLPQLEQILMTTVHVADGGMRDESLRQPSDIRSINPGFWYTSEKPSAGALVMSICSAENLGNTP